MTSFSFEEIAFEPNAFDSARDLRDLCSQFGFAQGRLVSELPRNWVKRVHERIAAMPDVEGAAAKRRLETLCRHSLVPSRFPYDGNFPWMENARRALQCHAVDGAVVSRLTPGDLPNIDAYFDTVRAKHNDEMRTTREDYRRACWRLVERGPRLVIVDPYFQVWKKSGLSLLKLLIEIGSAGRCSDFEVVLSRDVVEDKIGMRNFAGEAKTALGYGLPPRARVSFFAHPQLERELALHDRFLLTESGGIQVGLGFAIESMPRRTIVGALAPEYHQKLCARYLDRPLKSAGKVVEPLVVAA